MEDSRRPAASLWTRDFTIITAGTVVSMFGNAMADFAMSLMVLDISKSTLLYAVYLAMYTIPQIIMPIFSGAILDRYSRKKTIYTLDFISAGLYLVMAWALSTGWFSFPVFALFCFLLGCIISMYMVAYDSLYPLLITAGNYQKAYSIQSILDTMSMVMVPVAAFLYKGIGIAPLMAANAVCFFIAAVMETQIKNEEKYIENQKATALEGAGKGRQMLVDIKEGLRYLAGEKGLLAVTVYFAVIFTTGGIENVITLPYFKNTFTNGEYIYMLVWGCAVPVMMALCFLVGIGGVTTYTIRISAMQSYIPDERKGRVTGAFNMLVMLGAFLGEAIGGLASEFISERMIIMIAMLIQAALAVVIIGGNKAAISEIYNREQ